MTLARRLIATLVGAALVAVPSSAAPAHAAAALQEVMFVGNNWDGTVDVIHSRGASPRSDGSTSCPTRRSGSPRSTSIRSALVYYLGIQQGPGEGHDQLVDDMYTTPDGSALVASRPSFADVVSIDLDRRGPLAVPRSAATAPTTWRSRRTADRSPSPPPPRTPCTSWTSHRQAARLVRGRRQAAREHLHQGRPTTSGTCRSVR